MNRFKSPWEKEERKSRWEARAIIAGTFLGAGVLFCGAIKAAEFLFLHSHREDTAKERGYTPYKRDDNEYYLKMMGDTAVDMRYDIPGQLAIGNTYKIFDFKNSKVEIHNVTTTSSGGKNPTYTIYEDNKNLSFKNYNAGLYIETAVSQKELDKQLDVAQTFYQNRKPNSP